MGDPSRFDPPNQAHQAFTPRALSGRVLVEPRRGSSLTLHAFASRTTAEQCRDTNSSAEHIEQTHNASQTYEPRCVLQEDKGEDKEKENDTPSGVHCHCHSIKQPEWFTTGAG